jgi:hypothetical protein
MVHPAVDEESTENNPTDEKGTVHGIDPL